MDELKAFIDEIIDKAVAESEAEFDFAETKTPDELSVLYNEHLQKLIARTIPNNLENRDKLFQLKARAFNLFFDTITDDESVELNDN